MDAVNYSELRKNLQSVLDKVCNNHEPVIVTRRNGDNLVLLSYEDYSAIEETAYLLRSPKNAKRLRESIESFNKDQGVEQKLIEAD